MSDVSRIAAVIIRVGLLLVIAITFSTTPALARTIQVSSHFPAKYPEAGALRKLAVSGFSGSGGGDFASALITELTSVQMNGNPYFTVLSARTSTRGGPVSIGRAVGAEGIVTGDVITNVRQSPFQGIGFGCIRRNPDGSCAKLGLGQVPCIRRTIDVTVNARVIRVPDGRIVYSATKSKSVNIGSCSGKAPSKSDDAAVLDAFKPIVAEIRSDISPLTKKFKVKIKDDRKGLPKELEETFKSATKTVGSDLNSACTLWVQIYAAFPNHPSTVYDLGVCQEVVGDFAKAANFYQEAQRILPAGDRDVADAIVRIEGLLDAQEEFAKQEQARQKAQAEAARQAAAAARAKEKADAAARARQAAQVAAGKKASAAKRQEISTKYGAGPADAIMAGRVQKGMTMKQVLAAKGQPTKREQITAGSEQWYYPRLRIIFNKGRVSYIGS